jgi:phospholipase D1/2
MNVLVEGKNCWRQVRANRVAFLIDAADYFDAFARAAMRARNSILIVGWDFNSRTRLWGDRGDRPESDPPELLGDFLDELVRRRRGLRIRILVWDFPMIYVMDRETMPLFGLGWQPHRRIQLRYDRNFPVGGSQHQKIVVIDDAVAFVGGIDLANDRWDTSEHLANDPRRGTKTPSISYPPVHDVMVALDADAAGAVAELARERWRRATGESLRPLEIRNDAWPRDLQADLEQVDVAISRTEPAYDGRPEVREVEMLHVDMIAAAKRLIYIENQYLSSKRIGNAIAAKLQQPDCPDIVMVLRQSSDGWLEGPTMGALRALLLTRLRQADPYRRLHVYYPVVADLQERCINVHAKLCIVDDELARIGSANLNNRSMGLDTECDVCIEAGGDARVRSAIASLRNRLLAEHLDVTPDAVAAALAGTDSAAAAIETLSHGERRLVAMPVEDEWPASLAPLVEMLDIERPVAAEKLIEQFAPDATVMQSGHVLAWPLVVLSVLVGLFSLWRWTPLAGYVNPQTVIDWAGALAADPLGPLMVMAAYTLATFTMFPRTLITLAAVVVFGPLEGFVYAMLGILAAALLTYYGGRIPSRDTIRRIAGTRLNRLSRELRRRGLISMIAVRVIPVAPFIVVNMVAGAARIRLHHYVLGTIIGMLPGTLAATLLGGQLDTVLRDPGNVSFGLIALVMAVLLAAFLAARWWYRRRRPPD